jgi:hypothetical protein
MGLSLAGCATSDKVQAKQIADREMPCEQLVTENRKLDKIAGKVDYCGRISCKKVLSSHALKIL